MWKPIILAASSAALIAASPTDGARATLVRAAFATPQKAQAAALVDRSLGDLGAILARNANDRDALLQRGIGLGYKGQLARSVGDARAARDILTALARRYPADPEVLIALGGWHASVVAYVGGFVGSTVLGASRAQGLALLDKAVRFGGNRAFFPAYAGLMRIRLDPTDPQALALLDRAIAGQTPFEVDRITQAAAKRVAALVRGGDARGGSALARQLLPFGRAA